MDIPPIDLPKRLKKTDKSYTLTLPYQQPENETFPQRCKPEGHSGLLYGNSAGHFSHPRDEFDSIINPFRDGVIVARKQRPAYSAKLALTAW